MRKSVVSLVVALLLLALAAVPALAITYGTYDGDGHPNVGALIAETTPGEKDILCSGTLISPTVFLTASHCTAYLESLGITQVWVTFDSRFSDSSTLIPGTMHSNPNYNQRQDDTGDIAVIVLSKKVTGIKPAKLPTAGLFDEMAAQNGLKGEQFTAVGYGLQESVYGGGYPTNAFTRERWVSTSTYDALNPTWLRLSQNNATGDGGTCYGDSGGPNFLGTSDILAGITITGDSMCQATNVIYRLDTPSARDFLGQFVDLP